jgi:diguanylate cyclase (GGDEF)-like protein
MGDKVLCAIARVLLSQCRKTDLVSRYGGEEFAVIVPEVTAAEAAQLAERCRQNIASICLSIGTETVSITASFGVADAADATSQDALIQQSDEALYHAKNTGRNRVEVR